MKHQLKELANIQTGVYATPGLEANLIYFQAKHFDDQGKVNGLVRPELELSDKLERHLLQEGDVLLTSKGTRLFAACIDQFIGPAVASSNFVVIRISEDWRDRIKPLYLTWFLNLPESLNLLRASSRGSSLPSIPKSAVEEMLIPLPPVKYQIAILAIQKIRCEQKSLELKLGSLKDQLIHNQLFILANKQ